MTLIGKEEFLLFIKTVGDQFEPRVLYANNSFKQLGYPMYHTKNDKM